MLPGCAAVAVAVAVGAAVAAGAVEGAAVGFGRGPVATGVALAGPFGPAVDSGAAVAGGCGSAVTSGGATGGGAGVAGAEGSAEAVAATADGSAGGASAPPWNVTKRRSPPITTATPTTASASTTPLRERAPGAAPPAAQPGAVPAGPAVRPAAPPAVVLAGGAALCRAVAAGTPPARSCDVRQAGGVLMRSRIGARPVPERDRGDEPQRPLDPLQRGQRERRPEIDDGARGARRPT